VLGDAIAQVLAAQEASGKPLGIILAGHNGSGKSTMWRDHLSDRLQIPLVNADRMMLSVLPEVDDLLDLPPWAVALRDRHAPWMRVAQLGVEAFVAQAMIQQVPFATETVFSHWKEAADGTVESKIDKIRELQREGYFVLVMFVGLSNVELSIGRVLTRVAAGGHGIPEPRLRARFPRTQRAIAAAKSIADAAILVDNSLGPEDAFSVCRIQLGDRTLFDARQNGEPPVAITEWLDVVAHEAPQGPDGGA
jgi:predicted ABC-type ATPase